jgi:hypothetical protein
MWKLLDHPDHFLRTYGMRLSPLCTLGAIGAEQYYGASGQVEAISRSTAAAKSAAWTHLAGPCDDTRTVVAQATASVAAVDNRVLSRSEKRGQRNFDSKDVDKILHCTIQYRGKLIKQIKETGIEPKVSSFFTRRIAGLWSICYEKRLAVLKLHSLEYHRIFNDLVLCYKTLNDKLDTELSNVFKLYSNSCTRADAFMWYKIQCNLDCTEYNFTNRIIIMWNNLPEKVVSAKYQQQEVIADEDPSDRAKRPPPPYHHRHISP